MSVQENDFPRSEQVQWLQEFHGDKDSRKNLSDKQVLTAFLLAGANLIDDDGIMHTEESSLQTPYKVNGETFCCAHPLEYDEGANTFTCSVCGNEY